MGWSDPVSDASPKLSSPAASSGSGAYSNFTKAESEAKANPAGYTTAKDSISKAMNTLDVPADWLLPTLELVARESSFNPNAKNPASSASGLFQFLDNTRQNYGWQGINWSDPYQQSLAGIKYIKDRYGTPEKALQFWDAHNWY